ncbi:UNVERIFIED_ORG: hypothetical protein QFZ59_002512 [Bacillus sp. B2I3]|nr:hypothetical protein [Bacillus sp. B2I3]
MPKIYIINTNKQKSIANEIEMLKQEKCAAYFSPWKNKIDKIEANDLVFLYSNGQGIIARGIATGVLEKQDYEREADAEHYMHLNRFQKLERGAISPSDINDILGYTVVFNRTMIELPYDDGLKVWQHITKICL